MELRNLMYTAQLPDKGAFVIRYPRGKGFNVNWHNTMEELPVGKGVCLKEGDDLAVLTLGTMANPAEKAINRLENETGLSIAHYDARFVKPIDEALLRQICRKFKKIITIEDGTIIGGFGAAVLEFVSEHKYLVDVTRIGLPDQFVEHGSPDELYKLLELDEDGLYRKITKVLNVSYSS